jgi:DNA invertase Pin-like site-specific DNA recombinase
MNILPQAYSYIRFSSPTQSKGMSLERQDGRALEYASRKGLTLNTELNMRDLGVSAFKGLNVTDGALGGFLKAIDAGVVPVGSYLLIEDIDRLSRLPVMEALTVFQAIIGKGIIVVTLTNGTEYSQSSLNSDWTGLLPILVSMGRANEESIRKSDLVGRKWRQKKSDAREFLKPLGDNAPMWLNYDKVSYTVNENRALIIRRIFDLTINGCGKALIIKTLNRESIPSFKGKTWNTSSIQKILNNRAVIGEYQPFVGSGADRKPSGNPISGYYPRIITESTFYQAQQASASRRSAGATKQSDTYNVWQGIVRCIDCLSSLHLVNKGTPPKGSKYLHCAGARKGLCRAKAVRLDQSEIVFKEILTKVDSLSLVQDSSASIQVSITALNGQLSKEREKIVGYAESLRARHSKTIDDLNYECEQLILRLESEKEALLMKLASETIVDKADFISKLDLVSYPGRYRANELLKSLNIRVAILREGQDVRYVVRQDDKSILAINQSPENGISMVAFTQEMVSKISSQDFDGSDDSAIDLLYTESVSDYFLNHRWWDAKTLDEKIVEMLARTNSFIEPNSEEFQKIRNLIHAGQARVDAGVYAALDRLQKKYSI